MSKMIQTGNKVACKDESIKLPKTFGKATESREGRTLGGVEAKFAQKADEMVRERRGMA